MNIYRPPDWHAGEKRTAILFFFGGGWTRGSVEQGESRAKHFAAQGIVAICADYRVKDRHGTTPFEAIDDGRSAIEYVSTHATELGVDARRISCFGRIVGRTHRCLAGHTAPGESDAGGAGVVQPGCGYAEKPRGQRIPWSGRELEASPLHHVKQGMPPAILFHGTADEKVPIADAEAFCTAVRNVGSRCELVRYEGATHGFAGTAVRHRLCRYDREGRSVSAIPAPDALINR